MIAVDSRADYYMQLEILVSCLSHQILNPGDTAIDGGAGGGMHACPMARRVGPTGHIHAFEAHPKHVAWLSHVADRDGLRPQLSIYQTAIGKQLGEVQFMTNRDDSGLSHNQYGNDVISHRRSNEASISSPLTTIDHVVGTSSRVSFIKLDLEGGDFDALRGATAVIDASRPVIAFENTRATAAATRPKTFSRFSTRLAIR